jgi:non-canonical purine NTP pyrophosphatase (RdgB/HAM1 family)
LRRDFVFVTGNAGKLREAESLLGYRPESFALDLPELQTLELHEILRGKARAAFAALGRPVLVEDVSLELAALGGFPGPLVKWMLAAIGPQGIAKTAAALGDVRARAVSGLAYLDATGGEEELRIFEGAAEGTLVLGRRGEHGFGWDEVFQPAGSPLTYAELTPAEKDPASHRGKAWRAFLAALEASG